MFTDRGANVTVMALMQRINPLFDFLLFQQSILSEA